MCGIGGIIYFSDPEESGTFKIKGMSHELRHRGPDDEGFALFNDEDVLLAGGESTPERIYNSSIPYAPSVKLNDVYGKYKISLMHRRLSIIDPSLEGHQPMSYKEGRLWIVFNGEIYNYKELRSILELKGYTFISHTDTEIILASYLHWGKDCVHHFNGMWSFVIYDMDAHSLFCSRDRFGVKPFYYVINKHFFGFASEQKALVKIIKHPKINERAAFQYLVVGKTESEEQGLFDGILELMPSHNMEVNVKEGTITKFNYYSLSFENHWEKFNTKKYVEHTEKIKTLLTEAVKLRMRSDAPMGTCLSGGIDSSTLVSIVEQQKNIQFHEQIGERQRVFTASFKDEKIDESGWAGIVAKAKNCEWHQTYPDGEQFIKDIEDVAYAQDIPILGSSTFSQYRVMKLVHDNHIKVTLDGQGADELFSGYAPHFVAFFYEALKNGAFSEIKNSFKEVYPSFSNPSFLYQVPVKKALISSPSVLKFLARKEFKFLDHDFWNNHKDDSQYYPRLIGSSLNATLHQQFTGPELKVLLRTGDRNSMRFSVESRVPFADDTPLIEYLFSVPSVYKIRNGQSKSLLRDAMKSILPEEIRNRKDKLGFATPEYKWLISNKNILKTYITKELNDFINTDLLLNEWDKLFLTLSPYSTNRLFRILKFAIWRKVFNL